jgi:hypothetical protein
MDRLMHAETILVLITRRSNSAEAVVIFVEHRLATLDMLPRLKELIFRD